MNARFRAPAAGARRFQRARLPGVVAAILFAPAVASAGNESPDDVEFDAAFLPVGASSRLDLQRFSQEDYVAPGTYRGTCV